MNAEDQASFAADELPYHRWPKTYGGWQGGSIIRCEGADCQWCKSRWTLVDPRTLEEMPMKQPFQIGQKVRAVSDAVAGWIGDWQNIDLYIAGIRFSENYGFEIEVADRWPPRRGDVTDGWKAEYLTEVSP